MLKTLNNHFPRKFAVISGDRSDPKRVGQRILPMAIDPKLRKFNNHAG